MCIKKYPGTVFAICYLTSVAAVAEIISETPTCVGTCNDGCRTGGRPEKTGFDSNAFAGTCRTGHSRLNRKNIQRQWHTLLVITCLICGSYQVTRALIRLNETQDWILAL